MAHSFITNKDRLLSDIITGILPKSDAVDILVGYFYFSGYIQLADKLADNHLRIWFKAEFVDFDRPDAGKKSICQFLYLLYQ